MQNTPATANMNQPISINFDGAPHKTWTEVFNDCKSMQKEIMDETKRCSCV